MTDCYAIIINNSQLLIIIGFGYCPWRIFVEFPINNV